MKIALIGYGKMGRAIEQIALKRGHNVVLRISSANMQEMTIENLQKADIAIEFTHPASAMKNILKCLDAGIGVVSGSTGWNEDIQNISGIALEKGVPFIHASNFSIGVNIFFEVNKLLASLMNGHNEYSVAIDETHHTQKKDAPSGTAITLAEQIIANVRAVKHWELNGSTHPGTIPVFALRIENIPGTHTIKYTSGIDDIEITHTAHNREGFALGAVLAAEFIYDKKGVFTMRDVLGIK